MVPVGLAACGRTFFYSLPQFLGEGGGWRTTVCFGLNRWIQRALMGVVSGMRRLDGNVQMTIAEFASPATNLLFQLLWGSLRRIVDSKY